MGYIFHNLGEEGAFLFKSVIKLRSHEGKELHVSSHKHVPCLHDKMICKWRQRTSKSNRPEEKRAPICLTDKGLLSITYKQKINKKDQCVE